MKSVVNIFSLILCTKSFADVKCSRFNNLCTKDECLGSFQLIDAPAPQIGVSKSELEGEVIQTSNSVKYSHLRIGHYSAYCYGGGILFMDSAQCELQEKQIEISREEFQESIDRNMCKIGSFYSRELGSGFSNGDECLKPERHSWIPPRKMTHKGTSYKIPLIHTCVLDWDCDIYTGNTIPYYKYHNGLETVYVKPFSASHELFLEPGKETWVNDRNGQFLVQPIHIESYKVKVSCFDSAEERVCIETKGERVKNIFRSRGINKCVLNGNTALLKINCINGDIPYMEDVNVKILDSSSNINDLVNAYNNLVMENKQSLYNAAILASDVWTINSMLMKIIKIMSKKFPEIMLTILGEKAGLLPVWINEEIFKLCLCSLPQNVATLSQSSTKSNCYLGHELKNGEWVPHSDATECTAERGNVTNIGSNISMDFSVLESQQLNFSVSDFQEWIADKQLNDRLYKDKSRYEKSSILDRDFLDLIWDSIKFGFLYMSSLLSWVTFVILIRKKWF